jgi:hypothetical protein
VRAPGRGRAATPNGVIAAPTCRVAVLTDGFVS